MGVFAGHNSRVWGVTISFGERFAASDQFDAIFREGMALVERAAAYLDGPGRKEAKALVGTAAMVYASESMRLTTRLLELASWLMIRRSFKDGEISAEQLARKRQRVRLTEPGRISHVKGFDTLPEGLQDLVKASFALNDRIVRLDLAMQVRVDQPEAADRPAATASPVQASMQAPVQAQLTRLERAFAGRPRLRAVPTGS
jgi:regulator of CtrA degradation